MRKHSHKRSQLQYELAKKQRRLLVRHLYNLIDELEGRPFVRTYSPFPFGMLERSIHRVLDGIERIIRSQVQRHLSQRRRR